MSTSLAGDAPVLRQHAVRSPLGGSERGTAMLRPVGETAARSGAVRRRPAVGFDVSRVQILAVDSRPLVRSGLAGVARRAFGAGALPLADLDQALTAARFGGGAPRALLLGLRSGDDPAGLLEDARRIAPIVLFVLDRSDPALVRAALRAGADGFLAVEEATPDALTDALEAAESGMPSIPPLLAGVGEERLSDRSREVLVALADGLQDDEIAVRLGISTSSVRKHVANAQQRLGARTRTQAVAIATREELL